MLDGGFEAALRESVAEALEEMFFVSDLEECDPNVHATGPELTVRVDFAGSPSGTLTLRAGLASARLLAADFLGEDEDSIEDREATEVFSELANIVCGAVLTRTESACTFDLSPPRVVSREECADADGDAYAVALTDGPLTVFLKTEGSECRPSEKSVS
jgi:CheY-specific phosphatase CheX